MAQLNKQFNPEQHEAMVDFSALPAGEYIGRITKSEMKPTKNNQGQYLELEFTVDSPGFGGRKLWTRLNLVNQNPKAVEIAERELKSICDAAGVGAISDSNVLHGKPMVIKVKVDPATAQYGESNSITAYKSTGDMGTQQTVPGMENPEHQTTQTEAANQQAADKPAWAG